MNAVAERFIRTKATIWRSAHPTTIPT